MKDEATCYVRWRTHIKCGLVKNDVECLFWKWHARGVAHNEGGTCSSGCAACRLDGSRRYVNAHHVMTLSGQVRNTPGHITGGVRGTQRRETEKGNVTVRSNTVRELTTTCRSPGPGVDSSGRLPAWRAASVTRVHVTGSVSASGCGERSQHQLSVRVPDGPWRTVWKTASQGPQYHSNPCPRL